ncbi:hypothetical protein [Pseudacidovorax sp. RU35E]|jgi:hypothetical protein|uniref:hypothetical protein n=1 Tax=Pseudacidovorax sp. RU35E TaxID=1907403 RepID=UPI0009570D45|nr:hypothetical protein [Pseudacidovorax sp. RU35E]SIR64397.1 hypothetical protein SAMN05880557_11589 [Pseudacidovorax sp. RU35E]
MLHPVFSAALRHPALVGRHLLNYLALARVEVAQAGRSVVTRAIGGVIALLGALFTLGWGGVAVMLGVLHGRFEWVLVIVPGVAALLLLIGVVMLLRPPQLPLFAGLKNQAAEDMQVLQALSESSHADR